MLSKSTLVELESRCPEAVLVRAALENALPPLVVDQVFDENRCRQYNRKLLFSSIVQLLGMVICRVRPSVHAAFQLRAKQIGASIKAVYDKLNRTEPAISSGLVTATYQRLAPVIDRLGATRTALIRGYRTRLIDGNHLQATEHRLKPLRQISSGPLPGVAVVVYDRERELIESVEFSEDAYTQERQLVLPALERAEAGDLWIADRNFCTSTILWQLATVGAAFLIRRHAQNVRYETTGPERRRGTTETGRVFETPIRIADDFGNWMPSRLVRVILNQPTRDGESEIELLTNLPKRVSAVRVADAYRKRWDIEVAFADVARLFHGEIETLGQPRAALLAFALALVAYNAMSTVKSAMRAVHGATKVDEEVSLYYVAIKVQSAWEALDIFAKPTDWSRRFSTISPLQLARYLKHVAAQLNLAQLRKHPRGPKKPKPIRTHDPKRPHVATARLLNHAA